MMSWLVEASSAWFALELPLGGQKQTTYIRLVLLARKETKGDPQLGPSFGLSKTAQKSDICIITS